MRKLLGLAAVMAVMNLCQVATSQDRWDSGSAKTTGAVVPAVDRVDINHASVEEMLAVPGMKRSWAGRIVRFRPYRSKQDLLDGGIVNSQVYDRIRPFVIAHRDKH